jgi:hypothetical protein
LRTIITYSLALAVMAGANTEKAPNIVKDRIIQREEAQSDWLGPCSEPWHRKIRPAMGVERVTRRVDALIRCAVDEWSVPGGASYAIAIADRESSRWPWAVNEASGCLGTYQHIGSAWAGRAREYLEHAWFPWAWPVGALNARANVLVSIRMAHDPAIGWAPWGG